MNRPRKNEVKALSQRTPNTGKWSNKGSPHSASIEYRYTVLPRRPKELRENIASKHVPTPQNPLLRVLPYIPSPCLDYRLFLPIIVIFLAWGSSRWGTLRMLNVYLNRGSHWWRIEDIVSYSACKALQVVWVIGIWQPKSSSYGQYHLREGTFVVIFIGIGGEDRHRRKGKGVVERATVRYNQESCIWEAKLVFENQRWPTESRRQRAPPQNGDCLRRQSSLSKCRGYG